jgi:hypothetical protein
MYWQTYTTSNPPLGKHKTLLYVYTGSGDAPYYMKDDAGTCIPGIFSNLY